MAQASAKPARPKSSPQTKAVPQHLLYTGPEEQFEEPDEGVPSADELAQLSAVPPVAMQTVEQGVTPVAVQSVEQVKTPVAVQPVKQAVETSSTIEEFGGDYAAGEDFWQQALELVRSEKKMSMYSCAKGGRVYSFANDILVVAFKSAFQSQRMTKPDFREYFEGVLLRLARRQIRLQCEAEAELKKRAGGSKPQTALPKPQVATESKVQGLEQSELPENLQKAMHAFGGTITKLD